MYGVVYQYYKCLTAKDAIPIAIGSAKGAEGWRIYRHVTSLRSLHQ